MRRELITAGATVIQAPEQSRDAPAQRKFTLLVSSEDTELLPEQRKCVAEAATVEELFATVQEKLALPVEIMVLMYDEDFEEWILLPKLEDLPDKAKVQIKRKDE